MWVQSLGWEDPLKEGMTTHSSIPAWRILWTEEPGGQSPWSHKESDTAEATQHSTVINKYSYFQRTWCHADC